MDKAALLAAFTGASPQRPFHKPLPEDCVSYAELAEAAGVAVSAVRQKLKRAGVKSDGRFFPDGYVGASRGGFAYFKVSKIAQAFGLEKATGFERFTGGEP
jgi:hypothetical protein